MSMIFDIADFGAEKDSSALQTKALQGALDAARDNGGGEVVIPEGTYLTGGLRMYSHTCLHLMAGARLKGSTDPKDYPNFHLDSGLGYVTDPEFIEKWHLPDHYTNALITCYGETDISIIGEKGAVIDGSNCTDPSGEEGFRGPMGIVISLCRNVFLSGYEYVDSSNWAHQIDRSSNIEINGISVIAGHDGIDLHHCDNAVIKDCRLHTGDDCIAGYDNKNIIVSGCSLNTSCNSMRFGASNMLVENCRFWGPGEHCHIVSGRTNTLFAFEYYAHKADTVREKAGHWLVRDCRFSNIDSLIHYDFINEDHLQVSTPLTDVTFENCSFADIGGQSMFRNSTPDRSELYFSDCTFENCLSEKEFVLTGDGDQVSYDKCIFN